MGEETKEETNKEEAKEEKKEEEKKEEKKEEEPPEIVLKVDMHCEACARKVLRALKGFQGVEEVMTDCKSHKVVVKGKTADPVKISERVQRKSGRKVEIISPLPKPPEEEKKEEEKEKKEEEKKDEPPPVITVILQMYMHCEACAQLLRKRIRKIEGVESVEADVGSNKVVVKGVLDPTKLVESVYKKTKRQASIVPNEEKPEEKKEEEEKKKEEEEKEKEAEKKEEEGEDDDKKSEAKKSEYWPPKYSSEYAYAPQIFSDENPHACFIM